MVLQKWLFGEAHNVEINDQGFIDDQVVDVFENGHCHSLALAINQLTGWPMFGLVAPAAHNKPESPGHVVVKTNKGAYLDISGKGALTRWRGFHRNNVEVYPIDPEKANTLLNYLPANVEAAIPFAKTVLGKYCGIHL